MSTPAECTKDLKHGLKEIQVDSAQAILMRSVRRLIRRARLQLFKAYTRKGEPQTAQQVLRPILAVQPLSQAELLALGPSLAEQVTAQMQRIDALERGSIVVQCKDPCVVAIDETLVENPIQLPMGSYRLTVSSPNNDIDSLVQKIELSSDHPERLIQFHTKNTRLTTKAPQETRGSTALSSPEQRPPAPRIMPSHQMRDLAILKPEYPAIVPVFSRRTMQFWMFSALATSMLGSYLVIIHHRFCKRLLVVNQDYCKRGKAETQTPGIALLSVGTTALAAGALLLMVERIRGKRALSRALSPHNHVKQTLWRRTKNTFRFRRQPLRITN